MQLGKPCKHRTSVAISMVVMVNYYMLGTLAALLLGYGTDAFLGPLALPSQQSSLTRR